MNTSQPDLPERMLRNGREINNKFDPQEPLYSRCTKDGIVGDRLLPAAIKFPDWSVNRGEYSEPQDVLLPNWLNWGVATFKIIDVPVELSESGSACYEFKVEHDPMEFNYAHSEIRTYKDGVHHRKIEVSKIVKKKFRTILSERTKVILSPQV